ncbi:hypothetical protein MMC17_007146 [Xylographa soralifera]|nr:hypothetical protein [Xylographa soralifera]
MLQSAMALSAVQEQPEFLLRFPSQYDYQEDITLVGGGLPNQSYDFRPGPRQHTRLRTTWLDQDNSGDFDPNFEHPSPKTVIVSKRQRPHYSGEESGRFETKKPKLFSWQSGRHNGHSCPVTITLKSDRGAALLQYLGTFPDHWPEPGPADEQKEQNFTEVSLGSVKPQRLRQRNKIPSDSASLDAAQDDNLPSLADITLGHPAARGCKGCFEINSPCSLLQEGERYPCFDCREDNIDCELILPPPKKRQCESCRRRKIVCSYRISDDHAKPCQDCTKSGYNCVAGPFNGRTRTGPSLDQDFSQFIRTPERPYKSCTECRRSRKSCSLLSHPGYGDCNRCNALGQHCTFEAVVPDIKGIVRKQQTEVSKTFDDGIKATIPKVSSVKKTIKTRLAHPILFNYEASDNGSDPCHWCEDQIYGILGLAQVHVEVIDYQDGQGYVEIEGGHTAVGKPPSRMCGMCTCERLRITACTSHDLEQIEDADLDVVDPDTVMEWMTPGMSDSAPFEWCSLCPRPAKFACCSPVRVEDGADKGESGCGLKLCHDCACNLVSEHEGNLTKLITAMEEDDNLTIFEMRADINFLRSDGHLLSRIYAGR